MKLVEDPPWLRFNGAFKQYRYRYLYGVCMGIHRLRVSDEEIHNIGYACTLCLRMLEDCPKEIPDWLREELDETVIGMLARRFRSWGRSEPWRERPFYPRPRRRGRER